MSNVYYQFWIRDREHGSMRPYNPILDAWGPYFLHPPDKWPWEIVALVKEGPKAIVKWEPK